MKPSRLFAVAQVGDNMTMARLSAIRARSTGTSSREQVMTRQPASLEALRRGMADAAAGAGQDNGF